MKEGRPIESLLRTGFLTHEKQNKTNKIFLISDWKDSNSQPGDELVSAGTSCAMRLTLKFFLFIFSCLSTQSSLGQDLLRLWNTITVQLAHRKSWLNIQQRWLQPSNCFASKSSFYPRAPCHEEVRTQQDCNLHLPTSFLIKGFCGIPCHLPRSLYAQWRERKRCKTYLCNL